MLTVNAASGFGSGGVIAPMVLEDGGSGVESGNHSYKTFSSGGIGTAASNRIVVVMSGISSVVASGITIGGSAATKIVELDSGGAVASIWALAVTSGTTADIVCSISATTGAQAIYVAAMYGADISPHATATSDEDTPAPMSASLEIPAGGAAFGSAMYTHPSGYQSFVWSNLTEKADITSTYTYVDFTMAQTAVGGQTPTITCTVSSSGSANDRCAMALASFGPA